jgi:hypothetical protein
MLHGKSDLLVWLFEQTPKDYALDKLEVAVEHVGPMS